MSERVSAKECLRLLRFLNNNSDVSCNLFDDGREQRWLLQCQSNENAKMLCSKIVLGTLLGSDLISIRNDRVKLLQTGRKKLKRLEAPEDQFIDDAFRAQHRKSTNKKVMMDGAVHIANVNGNESPLDRLKARKDANGFPWISEPAFAAGERFRSDFTRAQMMPNTTSRWGEAFCSARSRGRSPGNVEISDTALDASRRLNNAVDFIGPELGGVLTDVCCFLKGLEAVERERRWPARSAKLMLRTGLDLLARHYGLISKSSPKKNGITHWAADGYRPSTMS